MLPGQEGREKPSGKEKDEPGEKKVEESQGRKWLLVKARKQRRRAGGSDVDYESRETDEDQGSTSDLEYEKQGEEGQKGGAGIKSSAKQDAKL
jgi:hypothetical protein